LAVIGRGGGGVFRISLELASRAVDDPSPNRPRFTRTGQPVTEETFERPYSGYAELIGYRLRRRAKGEAEVELRLEPKHLNRLLVPHGGVLATLLDTACGFAVAFAQGPEKVLPAVTLSLSMQFLGQAKAGELLVATARHDGGGKTIGFASATVSTETGRAIARGEATFRFLKPRS
jgi:uncharacterized protein (TIGR00369 family)